MQRTAPPGRAVFGARGSGPASEEVKARAQAAVQQLGGTGNVGARLMAQMGYGTAGAGLGRAGQVRAGVIVARPGLRPAYEARHTCAYVQMSDRNSVRQSIAWHPAILFYCCKWGRKCTSHAI